MRETRLDSYFSALPGPLVSAILPAHTAFAPAFLPRDMALASSIAESRRLGVFSQPGIVRASYFGHQGTRLIDQSKIGPYSPDGSSVGSNSDESPDDEIMTELKETDNEDRGVNNNDHPAVDARGDSPPDDAGRKPFPSLDPEWAEERFRVDRKKLEELLASDATFATVQHSNAMDTGGGFFRQIMEATGTSITWPSKLKIGAKSKKDPHIKVTGKRDQVRVAKERIMSKLDTKSQRVTLKMDVSFTDHSHVIGKGGNNIKKVMEETGCHIHFPDSNRANSGAEKSNQVSIAGHVEGVEAARKAIRRLLPLVLAFDSLVPIDANHPFVLKLQQTYNIAVMVKQKSSATNTVFVRGTVENEANVIQASKSLIELISRTFGAGPGILRPSLISTQMEISPQHHAFIQGKNEVLVKQIIQKTGVQIHFPDGVSTSPSTGGAHSSVAPLMGGADVLSVWLMQATAPSTSASNQGRKSSVFIWGNSVDNVVLARSMLIGCLPLVLMFDIKDDANGADTAQIAHYMESLNVYISVKPKPKQPSKSVIVKSMESNFANVYEARRLLVGSGGSPTSSPGNRLDQQSSNAARGLGLGMTENNPNISNSYSSTLLMESTMIDHRLPQQQLQLSAAYQILQSQQDLHCGFPTTVSQSIPFPLCPIPNSSDSIATPSNARHLANLTVSVTSCQTPSPQPPPPASMTGMSLPPEGARRSPTDAISSIFAAPTPLRHIAQHNRQHLQHWQMQHQLQQHSSMQALLHHGAAKQSSRSSPSDVGYGVRDAAVAAIAAEAGVKTHHPACRFSTQTDRQDVANASSKTAAAATPLLLVGGSTAVNPKSIPPLLTPPLDQRVPRNKATIGDGPASSSYISGVNAFPPPLIKSHFESEKVFQCNISGLPSPNESHMSLDAMSQMVAVPPPTPTPPPPPSTITQDIDFAPLPSNMVCYEANRNIKNEASQYVSFVQPGFTESTRTMSTSAMRPNGSSYVFPPAPSSASASVRGHAPCADRLKNPGINGSDGGKSGENAGRVIDNAIGGENGGGSNDGSLFVSPSNSGSTADLLSLRAAASGSPLTESTGGLGGILGVVMPENKTKESLPNTTLFPAAHDKRAPGCERRLQVSGEHLGVAPSISSCVIGTAPSSTSGLGDASYGIFGGNVVSNGQSPGEPMGEEVHDANSDCFASDYEEQKLLATKAMAKRPVGTESRRPTDMWSGLGFSKSMPENAIRDAMSHRGGLLPTNHEPPLAEADEEDSPREATTLPTGSRDPTTSAVLPSADYECHLGAVNMGLSATDPPSSEKARPPMPAPDRGREMEDEKGIAHRLYDLSISNYIDSSSLPKSIWTAFPHQPVPMLRSVNARDETTDTNPTEVTRPTTTLEPSAPLAGRPPLPPTHGPGTVPKMDSEVVPRGVYDSGVQHAAVGPASTPTEGNSEFRPDLPDLFSSYGLGKYIDLFQQQEIDLTTFLTLTEEDLRNLGISTFGARRKMLIAIADLNARTSTNVLQAHQQRISSTDDHANNVNTYSTQDISSRPSSSAFSTFPQPSGGGVSCSGSSFANYAPDHAASSFNGNSKGQAHLSNTNNSSHNSIGGRAEGSALPPADFPSFLSSSAHRFSQRLLGNRVSGSGAFNSASSSPSGSFSCEAVSRRSPSSSFTEGTAVSSSAPNRRGGGAPSPNSPLRPPPGFASSASASASNNGTPPTHPTGTSLFGPSDHANAPSALGSSFRFTHPPPHPDDDDRDAASVSTEIFPLGAKRDITRVMSSFSSHSSSVPPSPPPSFSSSFSSSLFNPSSRRHRHHNTAAARAALAPDAQHAAAAKGSSFSGSFSGRW